MDYLVHRLLGKGGDSEVFEARPSSLDLLVLKRLHQADRLL